MGGLNILPFYSSLNKQIMFTTRTEKIIEICASALYGETLTGIENVHLRGAMFGYYKQGSNQTKVDGRWPDKGLQLMKPGKFIKTIRRIVTGKQIGRAHV